MRIYPLAKEVSDGETILPECGSQNSSCHTLCRGYKWPTLNELHLPLFQEEFTDSHNVGVDVDACV